MSVIPRHSALAVLVLAYLFLHLLDVAPARFQALGASAEALSWLRALMHTALAALVILQLVLGGRAAMVLPSESQPVSPHRSVHIFTGGLVALFVVLHLWDVRTSLWGEAHQVAAWHLRDALAHPLRLTIYLGGITGLSVHLSYGLRAFVLRYLARGREARPALFVTGLVAAWVFFMGVNAIAFHATGSNLAQWLGLAAT